MKYEVSSKNTAVFVNCEAKSDLVAEQMCKNLVGVIKNMNRFKPSDTVEYNGCQFEVEYESYPEVIGDEQTGKTLYSVTKIGHDGLLWDEELVQALHQDIYEILSNKLTEQKNAA